MTTVLGKFLRKLRIDKGEILKDMADKLKVSASFLSAVENGKKRMPGGWNTLICELYDLSETQEQEFTSAIAETEHSIELNLGGAKEGAKELAVSFARKLPQFNNEQIAEIKRILTKGDK